MLDQIHVLYIQIRYSCLNIFNQVRRGGILSSSLCGLYIYVDDPSLLVNTDKIKYYIDDICIKWIMNILCRTFMFVPTSKIYVVLTGINQRILQLICALLVSDLTV